MEKLEKVKKPKEGILLEVSELLEKLADKHNMGIVFYATRYGVANPTPEDPTVVLLAHRMTPSSASAMGEQVALNPTLADPMALGWRKALLKGPANQNVDAEPLTSTVH